MRTLQQGINSIWYRRHFFAFFLLPLSGLYLVIISLRRQLYRFGLLPTRHLPVPNIVVGNLTVGGTGKTPLVIWLAHYLKANGYRPGVISRGYRGTHKNYVQHVSANSDPVAVGDEPVLIAQRSACPVAVSSCRYRAALKLIRQHHCDIIISDDGLQHYRLYQDIRICVIDGQRQFGNNHVLPAGPLREPRKYLKKMDIVITNGATDTIKYNMQYQPQALVNLKFPEKKMPLTKLKHVLIHAVAGIGNPDRFFALLRAKGMQLIQHAFPDHYHYRYNDINFNDDLAVVMTEKDAVKCATICAERHWFLPIDAQPSTPFITRLDTLLKEGSDGQKIT